MLATLVSIVLGACVGAGTPSAVSSTTSPSGTPGAPVSPEPTQLDVTVADNGTTVHLVVGQRFLLDLGSNLDWAVTVANQQVVARVPGVLVIAGAQGIYEARTAGTTLLSAVGSPTCPSGGACPQFRVAFSITITVAQP